MLKIVVIIATNFDIRIKRNDVITSYVIFVVKNVIQGVLFVRNNIKIDYYYISY
jgi:hypothetical protein